MEKHPIDDLFSRKLSGLNREPSGKVWERLQKEKQIETRWTAGRIRWMVAAAVALFLIAGNVLKDFWKTTESNQIGQVVTPNRKVDQSVAPIIDSASLLKSAQPPQLPDARTIAVTENPVKIVSTKVRNGFDEQHFIEQPASSEPTELDKIPVAVEPVPAMAVVQQDPTTASNLVGVELKNVVNENKEERKETARVVIVHVSVEKEDASKPSRFKRMLKQLQNAKDGEKVDWEEMGISPKKIFAHAGNE